MSVRIRGTTVIAVRRGSAVAMAADGQISFGETLMKSRARKILRLRSGRVLAGFAGSTADALALTERFESKLDSFGGSLRRAAIELAKDWRTDRILRRLEALPVSKVWPGHFQSLDCSEMKELIDSYL